MKKFLAFIMILMIAAGVFASNDVTVRAGGAFDVLTSKTPKSISYSNFDRINILTSGFGYNVGVDFDLSTSFQFYLDFSNTFPVVITRGDITETRGQNAEELKGLIEKLEEDGLDDAEGKTFFTSFAIHAGFSKIIDIKNVALKLSIGGGFGLERTSFGYKASAVKEEESGDPDLPPRKALYSGDYMTFTNISLDVRLGAQYSLGNKFSASFVLIPGLSFFNINKEYHREAPGVEYSTSIKPTNENSGFAFGFNLAVRIGASYTF